MDRDPIAQNAASDVFQERGLAVPLMVPWVPPWQSYAPYLAEMDAINIYGNHGPLCRAFEERLAEHFHVDPALVIATANGTLALVAATMALAPKPGARCLVGAFTFSAGIHAIKLAGAVPELSDIDPQTWTLCPSQAADLVAQGGAADLIQVSAPFGGPIDVAGWERLQRDTGVPVIVDWAAGFDCLRTSTLTAILSFHATKAFAIGEGGAVIAGSQEVADQVRSAINFGHDKARRVTGPGMNAKMSEIQAAVGLAMSDAWPDHRKTLFQRAKPLRQVLERFDIPIQAGWGENWISNTCVARVAPDLVAPVVAALDEAAIGWRRWWGPGVHREPEFRSLSPNQAFPGADDGAATAFGFPFHGQLNETQLTLLERALNTVPERIRAPSQKTN